ncbi:PIN-like domain-containing protein [Alicyclobacillus sp. SO9]|uniref:PIN-like domain-containing protein n=1 Tax=Alicyclobacillus sp. SO9 TaxID=2665646 RepID=UPI0018E7F194|nr:PIN-like domain-containing protein [Alicyclobacillus sp. SO9]QQE79628.1 DUF4935 domain-containing protein [Alicyclobacillus sp. SO9]
MFWTNKGTVIFDSSAYLNLYNFPHDTTQEILEKFSSIRDRVWLPYQVYTEFQNNKGRVIRKSFKKYEQIQQDVDSVLDDTIVKLYAILGKCDRFQYPTFEDLLDNVIGSLQEARTDLGGANEEIAHEKQQNKQYVKDDTVSDFVEKLRTNGQFGTPFGHSELIKIYVEGDTRYRLGIPPGFRDAHKMTEVKTDDYAEKRKAFGDLIIWKEIIKLACETEQDILLIIDDVKSDWWTHETVTHDKTKREHKKLVGPHDELVKEFHEYSRTGFYMLTLNEFIENLSKLHGFMDDMKLHFQLNKTNVLDHYVMDELRYSDEIDLNYIVRDLDTFFEHRAADYSVEFENIAFDEDSIHFSIDANKVEVSGRFVISVLVDGKLQGNDIAIKSVLFDIECQCDIELEVNSADFRDYTVLDGRIEYIRTISDDVVATISDDIDLYAIYDMQRRVRKALRKNAEDTISLHERKLYDAFGDVTFYSLEQLDGVI